jgi:hypothetical protein
MTLARFCLALGLASFGTATEYDSSAFRGGAVGLWLVAAAIFLVEGFLSDRETAK